MNLFFVSYADGTNKIEPAYGENSLLIICFILLLLTLLFLKRKPKPAEDFLTIDTSNALRGVGIFFLLFGHLSLICIDGKQFFEYAGIWAVIIFIYVSGIALIKTYGLEALDRSFVIKRIKKLAAPTWITLGIFYLLDAALLHKHYSIKMMALNFCGIISPAAPNGPAWFVTYIILFYLFFFFVSRIKLNAIIKVVLLLLLSYMCTLIIWQNGLLGYHFGIWAQYSVVFPLAVGIGFYRTETTRMLSSLYKHPAIYFPILAIFLYQFYSGKGLNTAIRLFHSSTYEEIVKTAAPASLVIALTMISFFLDRLPYYSAFLNWIGKYSFEIFLVHMPFMVGYDFFLFRKPLGFYFFVYFSIILLFSIVLNRTTNKINMSFFSNGSAASKATVARSRPNRLPVMP